MFLGVRIGNTSMKTFITFLMPCLCRLDGLRTSEVKGQIRRLNVPCGT